MDQIPSSTLFVYPNELKGVFTFLLLKNKKVFCDTLELYKIQVLVSFFEVIKI